MKRNENGFIQLTRTEVGDQCIKSSSKKKKSEKNVLNRTGIPQYYTKNQKISYLFSTKSFVSKPATKIESNPCPFSNKSWQGKLWSKFYQDHKISKKSFLAIDGKNVESIAVKFKITSTNLNSSIKKTLQYENRLFDSKKDLYDFILVIAKSIDALMMNLSDECEYRVIACCVICYTDGTFDSSNGWSFSAMLDKLELEIWADSNGEPYVKKSKNVIHQTTTDRYMAAQEEFNLIMKQMKSN